MRHVFCALLLLVLGSLPASAASLDEAQALYDRGAYDEAADMAAALKTADGFLLASKALIGKTNLLPRKERSLDDLSRATRYAEKAFEMEPDLVAAHLQYSSSLGLRGRLISKVRVQMEQLPEKAKTHLDIAYGLAPESPWANAFLGAWNLEIVRNGGATLGKALYGASIETGLPLYERAMTLEPKSLVLTYEFAQTLLAQDYWQNREAAAALLAMAAAMEPKNHQERAIHQRVQDLQAGLAADDGQAVLDLVAKHLGSKPIRLAKPPKE